MNTTELSFQEQTRYDECSHIISEGLKTCFEVGEALVEIRDFRLYREEFASFEEFCQKKYQIGRRRIDQLIVAAEVKQSIDTEKVQQNGKNGENHGSRSEKNNNHASQNPASLITNERQARALAKVEPEKRVDVIQKAASSGAVTSKSIAAAAKVQPPVGQIFFDKVGRAIPPKILPLWQRAAEEAKMSMDALSKIRCSLKASQEAGDIVYREMTITSTLSYLNNAYGDYQRIAPYAVCHSCQGLKPEKCTACKERGFVSKFFWDMCVPVEFKKLFTNGK